MTTATTTEGKGVAETLRNLYEPIRDDLAREDAILRTALSSDDPYISSLLDYASRFQGKRIRSALLFLSARACGDVRHDHIVSAAVVELVHLATLAHDDVLDEADKRRLGDSLNERWGNEASVLFGDYLFANAFTLCAELKSPELISLLARTTKKMCAGELSQTAMRFNLAISEEEYVRMIELKTASLFAASCQIGAMSGGAARDRLAGFGLAVGTAFQIVDDCLDIVGNETSMGKKPGNDVARGKFTLPVIRLLRLLPGEEKKSLSELLLSPDDSGEKRTRVCELVERFGTADYAMEKARSLVQKAKEDIVAGDSRCVATLRALADFAVERSW